LLFVAITIKKAHKRAHFTEKLFNTQFCNVTVPLAFFWKKVNELLKILYLAKTRGEIFYHTAYPAIVK
jgi:hypothetical protein